MSSGDASARSTPFRTRLAPRALRDVEDVYVYIARDAAVAAERWIAELLDAVEGLSMFPHRCARASEEAVLRIGLRQRVLGNYRILFTIDDEARMVNVLHVRHAARHPVELEELA